MNAAGFVSHLAGTQRFSVLVGAGLSAVYPTCLPSWKTLNDTVICAVGDAIGRVTEHAGLSVDFVRAVTERRATEFLMPDLQAQLIEDEMGAAYFRSLTAIDSTSTNAGHQLLCEMARQGRVSAIFTTNFDTTIERAFDASGVPYELFDSPAAFEGLNDAAHVPIVKIHGSADKPDTMVDTLRQRLQHRPAVLERYLKQRFIDTPTVALGFSCEDLRYDPDYLAIRPAIREGATFCFLVRTGSEPSEPLGALIDEFPDGVHIARGVLPDWLFEIAATTGMKHDIPSPEFSAEEREQRAQSAKAALEGDMREWAASLDRLSIVNAATALFSAAGERHLADAILKRTWTHFRTDDDCSGPAYARYLHNYGETLFRAGHFTNPHDRELDPRAWAAAAEQDPRQFFMRAVRHGAGPDSKARAALSYFLGGKPTSSLDPLLRDMFGDLLGQPFGALSRHWIDACFSFAETLEWQGRAAWAQDLLENAHQSAIGDGDELRRAEAAWRLARNLAFGEAGTRDNARILDLTCECRAIAARLDIRKADAGAALASAIAASTRLDPEKAEAAARTAAQTYRSIGDVPGEMLATREHLRAHMYADGVRQGAVDVATWDELSLSLQRYGFERAPGLLAIFKYELAMVARTFDDQLAFDLATDSAEIALRQEHPLLSIEATKLRDAIAAER